MDDAPERAIAIARRMVGGELGVIEGCRTLSSMRWELEAEMADQFLPFVAIDSETDDLPIGAVRDLWDLDALARKDQQFRRYEQIYRTQAIEACLVLIKHLGQTHR